MSQDHQYVCDNSVYYCTVTTCHKTVTATSAERVVLSLCSQPRLVCLVLCCPVSPQKTWCDVTGRTETNTPFTFVKNLPLDKKGCNMWLTVFLKACDLRLLVCCVVILLRSILNVTNFSLKADTRETFSNSWSWMVVSWTDWRPRNNLCDKTHGLSSES